MRIIDGYSLLQFDMKGDRESDFESTVQMSTQSVIGFGKTLLFAVVSQTGLPRWWKSFDVGDGRQQRDGTGTPIMLVRGLHVCTCGPIQTGHHFLRVFNYPAFM